MKEQIQKFISDHIIGFLGSLALCVLVLFFSDEIHKYLGTKNNKTEFQKIEPVDRSRERSIEDCLGKRIPVEVIQFCTKEFQEDSQ